MNVKPGILLVANWDSNVGYAWWLMESFWGQLANAYSPSHAVYLAFPSISKISDRLQAADIQFLVLDFNDTSIANVRKQGRFIREHNIRLAYLTDHNNTSWRYLYYRLSGLQLLVSHDHTPGMRAEPGVPRKWFKALLGRLSWINVDAAYATTDFVRERLVNVNCLPARKCFVVPNGLPPAAATVPENLVERFGIAQNSTVVVSTGRANHYKGVGLMLEAIAALVAKGRNVHFLYCGDGPDLDEFRALVREQGLSSRVTFAGRIEDVGRVLAACDIAFSASQGEVGYSLSILEYMQLGLPVVVTDNPSVCGATEHGVTGLHFEEGNVEAAASAIAKLLDDAERRVEMGERAKEVVNNKYSLDQTYQSLLEATAAVDTRGFPAANTTA